MEWIRFDDLSCSYGARRVFSGLAGVLRDGDKVGLVGLNGAGKSSLVRILANRDEPEAGSIVRAAGAALGYLDQSAATEVVGTLRMLLDRAFSRVHEEEAGVRRLESELSVAAQREDSVLEARLLRRYGEARESFDRHGGLGHDRRMRSMLSAFGFSEADLDRPADGFSGGQRTRAALARMLLEEPDYMILDEPTNHLDIETVRWLEDFLIEDPRATLVVSHDRYLLDRVANQMWELDGGELAGYDVPQGRAYEDFVAQKAARKDLAERAYERFRDEEKRRKAVVAELRTHGSHNYSHVRSREKQLAKLERVEAPKTAQQHISVSLRATRRATNGLALVARDVTVAYGAPLFSKLSFQLKRGERLAVVGPNGSGKSTLLNVLAQRRAADSGGVDVMRGVSTAYFSQDATDELPRGVAAVDAVMEGSNVAPERARSLLGRLGLGGDAGDKPVEAFSGGERRRIMLARLMARSADLLFLDEPTNDLDISSREALEAVLAAYAGAMIVVSHDRYLLRRLAERVVWVRDGTATVLEGGYERFEAAQRSSSQPPSTASAKPANAATRDGSRERTAHSRQERDAREQDVRELAQCEREVARLDAERARLELEFADPAIYDDRARVSALELQLEGVRTDLDATLERWERLADTTSS